MKQITVNLQVDDNGDVVAVRAASNSQGAVVASPGGESSMHAAPADRAQSPLAAVATGASGGTGTSPVAGPQGATGNLGTINAQQGDVLDLALLFPTAENGEGQAIVNTLPGTEFAFRGQVPAYVHGRGGHLSFAAVHGKDNLVIGASIGLGDGLPLDADGTGVFWPYNVGIPEEIGFSNLAAGPTYTVRVRATSGTFMIENQLPR